MPTFIVDETTIEFVHDNYWLCQRGYYSEESVLAGQRGRQLVKPYDTLEEALQDNPDTKESDSYYMAPMVPINPPSWFDPMDAGERWDEDY